MFIILLIAGFILILLIDLPALLTEREQPKSLIVYSLLLLTGFVISLLQVIDREPPSPALLIEKIIDLILRR